MKISLRHCVGLVTALIVVSLSVQEAHSAPKRRDAVRAEQVGKNRHKPHVAKNAAMKAAVIGRFEDLRYPEVGAASSPVLPSLVGGSGDIVAEARRYLGGNPTGKSSLWCARFMNFVLKRVGYRGTGSDAARSFASYGRRIHGPRIGAIAVMRRGKSGGHVGVVSGITPSGDPVIISGNYGRKVAEAVFPKERIYAYVVPN